jgi:hypothetical protein
VHGHIAQFFPDREEAKPSDLARIDLQLSVTPMHTVYFIFVLKRADFISQPCNSSLSECVHAPYDATGAMLKRGCGYSNWSTTDFTLELIWAPEQPIICPARKLPRYATFRQVKGPR